MSNKNTAKPKSAKATKPEVPTFFVIRNAEGQYWQKWTGASISGRPKWVDSVTAGCLFAREPKNSADSGCTVLPVTLTIG